MAEHEEDLEVSRRYRELGREEPPRALDDAIRAEAPAAPAARQQMQARALAKAESPEQALERIAELRKQGRDEEADKALAEFRKRYPDFRISEEMLKRVEKSGSATDFPKRESDTEN